MDREPVATPTTQDTTTTTTAPTHTGGGTGMEPKSNGALKSMDYKDQTAKLTPPSEPPPKRPPGIAPTGDFDARMAAWGPAAAKACDPVAFMTSGPKGHLARGRDTKLGFFAQARGRLLLIATEITSYLATATDLSAAQRQQLETLVATLTGFRDLYGAIEDSAMSGGDVRNPAKRAAMTQRVQAVAAGARGPAMALDPAIIGAATVGRVQYSLNELDVFIGAWSEMAGDPANTDASPQMWMAFLQTVERERMMLNHYGKLAERGGDTSGVKRMAARRKNGATVTRGSEYDAMVAEKGGGMALAIESYSHKAADMAAMNAQIAVMIERVNRGEFATQAEAVAAFRAFVGSGQASEAYYRQLDAMAAGSWDAAAERARQQKEEEETRRRLAERDRNMRTLTGRDNVNVDPQANDRARAGGVFASVGGFLDAITGIADQFASDSGYLEIEVKAAIAAVVYLKFEGTLKVTKKPDGRCEIESGLVLGIGVGAIAGNGKVGADVAVTWDDVAALKSSGDSVAECVDLIGLYIYGWLASQDEASLRAHGVRAGTWMSAFPSVGMKGLGLVTAAGSNMLLPDGQQLADALFGGDFVPRVIENMNTEEGDKADRVELKTGEGVAGRVFGMASGDLGKVAGELTADYSTSSTVGLQKGKDGALTMDRSAKNWSANAAGKIVAEVDPVAIEGSFKAESGKGKYGLMSEFELKAEMKLGGLVGAIIPPLLAALGAWIDQADTQVANGPDSAPARQRLTAMRAALPVIIGQVEASADFLGATPGIGAKLLLGWTGKEDGMKVRCEHIIVGEVDGIAGEGIGGRFAGKIASGALLFEIAV